MTVLRLFDDSPLLHPARLDAAVGWAVDVGAVCPRGHRRLAVAVAADVAAPVVRTGRLDRLFPRPAGSTSMPAKVCTYYYYVKFSFRRVEALARARAGRRRRRRPPPAPHRTGCRRERRWREKDNGEEIPTNRLVWSVPRKKLRHGPTARRRPWCCCGPDLRLPLHCAAQAGDQQDTQTQRAKAVDGSWMDGWMAMEEPTVSAAVVARPVGREGNGRTGRVLDRKGRQRKEGRIPRLLPKRRESTARRPRSARRSRTSPFQKSTPTPSFHVSFLPASRANASVLLLPFAPTWLPLSFIYTQTKIWLVLAEYSEAVEFPCLSVPSFEF